MMKALVLAFAAMAAAQNPVAWSLARTGGGAVAPGAKIELVATARIEPGWALYSVTQPPGGPIPTRISMPAGQAFAQDGALNSDAPSRKHDATFDMEVEYHAGEVEFRIPARVAASASGGEHKARVEARYQSCNDKICLPPRTAVMELAVTVNK
jgi:hypothetical protein